MSRSFLLMGVGRGGGQKNECQHRKDQGLNQADEKFHNIKWQRDEVRNKVRNYHQEDFAGKNITKQPEAKG